MTVYHGSICEIRTPDISRAKSRLDFGRAFYLTSYKPQAEKWAKRKAARTKGKPVVSVYHLADDISNLRFKDFGTTDGEWLDFICACRSGKTVWRQFDVIKGRVANDDVFKTVDAYLKGDMTREAALRELRYAKPNDQVAITNARTLSSVLAFKRSYVVPGAW